MDMRSEPPRRSVNMPSKVYIAFEEPAAASKHFMPAGMSEVVTKVGQGVEANVAILAHHIGDHPGRKPMPGTEYIWQMRRES